MKTWRALALIMLVCGAVQIAGAQAYVTDDEDQPKRKQPLPAAGFWPTQRMVDLAIDRIVEDQLAGVYSLDEDQIYNTKELIKERFPQWMEENRGEIMQLTNEWFETLLSGEAPSAETVASMAQRALPLMNQFAEQVEQTAGEMRTFMTEDQQVVMDGQLAAFRVGVSFGNQRLMDWSEGNFDPENEWFDTEAGRRRQREKEEEMQAEMKRAERQAMGLPPDEPDSNAQGAGEAERQRGAAPVKAKQKDAWEVYVDAFVKRYELNADQEAQARKMLKSAQEQRDRYMRRKGGTIDRAEQRLKLADNEREKEVATGDLERLKKPLERMFTILKEKLQVVPTREQRQAALKKPAIDGEGAAAKAEGTAAP